MNPDTINTGGNPAPAGPVLMGEAQKLGAMMPRASVTGVYDREGVRPLALLPPGWSTKDLTGMLPKVAPTYRAASVPLYSILSLVAYVTRWATAETTVWLDRQKNKVLAMLDDGDGADTVGRRAHQAFYVAEFSEEFKEWQDAAGRAFLGQKEFITFIEEHDRHFVQPTGARMRTVANQLEVKKGVSFKNVEREDSAAADVSLVYETQTTETGMVKCPPEVKIRIPIYRGGALYDITCRLRFDVREGQLVFMLRLPEKQRLVDEAWRQLVGTLTEELAHVGTEDWSVPVFEGEGPSRLDG